MNIFEEYQEEMEEINEWFSEEILIQDPKLLPILPKNNLKKYW